MPPGWLDRAAYPFESRWCPLPDGRLHYLDEGRGEPILFSHGTPTWSFEYRHLIRELAKTHRCVAPDHLGFGLSDRPAGGQYTPEAHARRFTQLVDRLELGPLTLVVHDYGGPIAFPLCLDRPAQVRRLVILNTWMWALDDDREIRRGARVVEGRVGRWLYAHANLSLRAIMPSAYGDRRKLTPAIHAQYRAVFPTPESRRQVLWPLARALLGSSPFYRALWEKRGNLRGRPTLIVWGLKDSAFRPHQLQRWRELLADARIVELPGSGHWPHEEEPEKVLTAMREFLHSP